MGFSSAAFLDCRLLRLSLIRLFSATTLTVFLSFPDSSLEAAIREAINKPEGPIVISDLEPFTALETRGRGISDLTGLEYCINLQVLEPLNNMAAAGALFV